MKAPEEIKKSHKVIFFTLTLQIPLNIAININIYIKVVLLVLG